MTKSLGNFRRLIFGEGFSIQGGLHTKPRLTPQQTTENGRRTPARKRGRATERSSCHPPSVFCRLSLSLPRVQHTPPIPGHPLCAAGSIAGSRILIRSVSPRVFGAPEPLLAALFPHPPRLKPPQRGVNPAVRCGFHPRLRVGACGGPRARADRADGGRCLAEAWHLAEPRARFHRRGTGTVRAM